MPLQRDPSLVPLSHDHHDALLRVFHIRQALRAGAELDAAATATRQFFARDLVPHFRAEEEVLLPVLRTALGAEHPLLAMLVDDHRMLERLARDLDGSPQRLSAFANLLERHIRFEERELFQQYQGHVPQAARADVEAGVRRILNRPAGAPKMCDVPEDVAPLKRRER